FLLPLRQHFAVLVIDFVAEIELGNFLGFVRRGVQRNLEIAVGVSLRAAAIQIHCRGRQDFVERLLVRNPQRDLYDVFHFSPTSLLDWLSRKPGALHLKPFVSTYRQSSPARASRYLQTARYLQTGSTISGSLRRAWRSTGMQRRRPLARRDRTPRY